VCEPFEEHNEMHGDCEIDKIVEKIQSSILPINGSLGENSVDELIGFDNSTSKDKRIGKLERKIKEMTVIDEFFKNKKVIFKDSSIRFQEEISQLRKENKNSLRKAQRWYS
jgi:hypothetical protein